MRIKKHKRKMNHVVIVTSDAVDASVKQYRFRPWILQTVIFTLCIVVGTLIGYLNYEQEAWDVISRHNISLQNSVNTLKEENEILTSQKQQAEAQIADLGAQIEELNETVSEKTQSESELMAQLESQSYPDEFPLRGLATMEESDDDEMCVFSTAEGTTVVATAQGTVTAVNDDVEYGHSIWVDHGNGYITIYKNEGDVTVFEGDSVVQGSTLFVVDDKDLKLVYQMKKDGEYINPMDMLMING